MVLRVTATGRSGVVSDRAAAHNSAKGVTSSGACWAIDVKVERSSSHTLREGSITHFLGEP
jgi:hypothetical protein